MEVSGITIIAELHRIQELVKLLQIDSFRFIYCHQLGDSADWSYSYEIKVSDYNKLNSYINPIISESKRINIFKRILRKVFNK